ncbi:uncharacterized protein LOC132628946 [Lycium barbarum]|uniref:uncharacterized protein LOC132628946 n=1 Tax=Lycium barbarum TaxID=112863 RepID=UPI00293F4516|nr:uncharacterized protein LOC132628946 [Lycium barbarum]
MDECSLQDAGFFGNIHTWSDNRGPPTTIWMRLDRLLYNEEWADEFSETTVQHLARVCSDHAPLLITMRKVLANVPRYLKFLDFWTEHESFEAVVKEVWQEPVEGNPMWILHQKLKKTNKRAELNEAKAEYVQFLKLQEVVLRQKAKANWLTDGDRNTAYFHSVIKGRRKKLSLQRIQDNTGQWREGTEDVANALVDYFQNIFNSDNSTGDFRSLNCISPRVT